MVKIHKKVYTILLKITKKDGIVTTAREVVECKKRVGDRRATENK